VLQAIRGPDDQKVPAPAQPTPSTPTGRPMQHADRNREIARRYMTGESSIALAKEIGVSRRTIRDAVVSAGGTLRPVGRYSRDRAPQSRRPRMPVPLDQKQAIIARYRAGAGIEDIARDCQISTGMLYTILHATNVPLRGAARGPRKKAATTVAGTEPRPIGAITCLPVHYALRRVRYEEPIVAVTVTLGRPPRPAYSPDALRPAYQQVRR